MNIKNMIRLSMVVVGLGLIFIVISLDEPNINAYVLAIAGALALVLANEVE